MDNKMTSMVDSEYLYTYVHFVKGGFYYTKNLGENTYLIFECIDSDKHAWVKFKVLSDSDTDPDTRFNSGDVVSYTRYSEVVWNTTTKRISEAKAVALAL